MCVDDDIDFFRGNAARDEFLRKPRRGVEGIDLSALCVPLVSCTSLQQNPLPCRANQQRIHRHQDPIAAVGRRNALPHGFRDYAKHRAAIEPERSVGNQPEFEVAEFHALFFNAVLLRSPYGNWYSTTSAAKA